MSSRLLPLCVVALLALAAGCNVAPNYHVPTTDTSPAYKEAVTQSSNAGGPPDLGWKLAEPSDQQLRGAWWELYNDPDLNALEEKIAKSNLSVLSAEAKFREARALVAGAWGALLPEVSVAPSVVRSRTSAANGSSNSRSTTSTTTNPDGTQTSTTTGNGGSTSGSTRTLYTLPVDATYEIDLWGRVRNTISQNASAAQGAAADWANVLLSEQAELAQDYFQLRAVDEQRRILQSTLADYQASLQIVNSLYGSGLASEEDLARARTQVGSAQAQETDLAITRAQYEHAIAVLIGVPPAKFALAPKEFSSRLPAIPVGLPSELVERRPDVASAERQVASANAGIGVARAAYFPSLTINASAGFESTSAAHLLDWPNRFWSVGPQLAESIFDGGVRRALTEKARATYDQTVADYRLAVLKAFQSVEDSLSSLRFLQEEERQQKTAVDASLQAVRLSVTRYQNGIDSYVNVITAQSTFLTNRELELQIQLRALVASVGLIKNLGGGWDASRIPGLPFETKIQKPRTKQDDRPMAAPNPPPLPPPVKTPEQLLREDEQTRAAAQHPGGGVGS